jgi:hypothetical protein
MKEEIKDRYGEVLYFATSLSTYINSHKKTPLFIGDWLVTLSDDELLKLSDIAKKMETNDKSATDHIVMILILATSAELRREKIKLKPEQMPAIGMLVSFEKMIRSGYIKLQKPLSLTGEIAFEITDQGIKAGMDIDKLRNSVTYH